MLLNVQSRGMYVVVLCFMCGVNARLNKFSHLFCPVLHTHTQAVVLCQPGGHLIYSKEVAMDSGKIYEE